MTTTLLLINVLLKFEVARTLIFHQHPRTQHVLTNSNSTFSCSVLHAADTKWYAYFPNRNISRFLYGSTEDVVSFSTDQEGDTINTTITINARTNWNNTILKCYAIQSTGKYSYPASLIIYTSLRPLPPSGLQITSVNSSSVIVNWKPTLLWEQYQIDYYNVTMVIRNHSGMLTFISMRVESPEYHYTFVDFFLLSCTQYNFSVAAVNEIYGESDYVNVTGNIGSGLNEELNVDAAVYFRSNGSPIVDVIIQLPSSVCSFEYLSINYTVIDMEIMNKTVVSGILTHHGGGNRTFSIMSGLVMDHNYMLMILIISSSGDLHNVISSSTPFDTMLLLNNHFSCSGNKHNESKDTLYYKMAIGICLNVALMTFIVSAIVIVCVCARKMKIICDKRLHGSTSRVANAMVHNPIYDGPVYESVQNQFATFKSTEEQAAGISDNSACSTQSSTHITTSDNTVRYADPPVQISKIRSNSFVSGIPPHSSTPSSDADNVPRSTTVSIPAPKRNAKERNILHLTLALTGNDLSMNDEPQPSQNYNPLPIGGEANRVVLTDEDEHYTVMSPAGVTSNSGKGGWCGLSPEDVAQKYRE